ncbi:MAG TPA: hypothetical protein VKI62_02155, partial [Bacteroidota bacterium]|nr:hypothetical protein [Bacteroidota bacterium]
MKRQLLFVFFVIVAASLSINFVYGKGDDKASCCQKMTKASLTTKSNTTTTAECTDADKVSCCQKGTKASMGSSAKCDMAKMATCSAADKASCPMAKNTKASLKKVNSKSANCCTGKTKASEAKNSKSTQD